ncbi:hypothetical protein D0T84_01200 [Dysgonomonas sp. 521]|uniref:hypothetical protein n=1 Tax=Dysgonomonas sp. 521 TaxID=2302932 RepID=UPI0013D29698|nr:hypothetical protein [Dysgonomonas sp. 521]NDV93533.1 hypothetical protein [Dysgonomonas sp. 521]
MKNFKTTLKIAFIGSVLALAVSCKTQQPQTQVEIKTIEKEVEKLVPYALPPDSAAIEALFECDSLNQVQLKELKELKAKGWQSSFFFNNGFLQYKMYQPPDTIYIPGKDRYIYQDVPVEVVKEVIVYKQTDWQIVCGWFGKIFMAVIGIGLIVLVLKWKRLF